MKLRTVIFWSALAMLLPLACGCAHQPATSPADDHLGSVNDLLGSAWKHEDAAATSNGKTLDSIRRAESALDQ